MTVYGGGNTIRVMFFKVREKRKNDHEFYVELGSGCAIVSRCNRRKGGWGAEGGL